MPAQRIEGNQDGAGDYNDGGEEEHCSLRHRAALDLRLLLFLNQRAALWCVQASTAELGALYAPNLDTGSSWGAQRLPKACMQHGLFYRTTLTGRCSPGASSPLRSVCLKANWLFGSNGTKWDLLDGRTSSTKRASASARRYSHRSPLVSVRYPTCHSRSTHQRANRPKNLCANLRNKRSLDAGPGARKESASRTCRGIVRRSVALGAGREEASFALGISRCPSVTQGSPWIARSPWPLGRGGSKTHQ
jgi:hypothetical protein